MGVFHFEHALRPTEAFYPLFFGVGIRVGSELLLDVLELRRVVEDELIQKLESADERVRVGVHQPGHRELTREVNDLRAVAGD